MGNKLIINIGASADSFGAYGENCSGIFASGDNVAEVKRDVLEAIRIYKEITPESEWDTPIKEGWPIEWHYDTQSLLKYYEGILTNAALERLTGINKNNCGITPTAFPDREKKREKKSTRHCTHWVKNFWN